MFDCTVEVEGAEYFVQGDVVMNEDNGQINCPNCDSIKNVITSRPGLENVSIRMIKKDGDLYQHSTNPSSPLGIRATAEAEEYLQVEAETTHHCTECNIKF